MPGRWDAVSSVPAPAGSQAAPICAVAGGASAAGADGLPCRAARAGSGTATGAGKGGAAAAAGVAEAGASLAASRLANQDVAIDKMDCYSPRAFPAGPQQGKIEGFSPSDRRAPP